MNVYKNILALACILVFVIAAFVICTSGKDVHDNGERADSIRNELEHAEGTQQRETDVIAETAGAIDESTRAIDESRQRIDESTRANQAIGKIERTDTELLGECQQILAEIRARGATKN